MKSDGALVETIGGVAVDMLTGSEAEDSTSEDSDSDVEDDNKVEGDRS